MKLRGPKKVKGFEKKTEVGNAFTKRDPFIRKKKKRNSVSE